MVKTVLFPLSSKQNVSFHIGQRASDHFMMLDQAKPTDLWFHLEDYPSCHIIASVPDCINRDDIRKLIRYGIRLSKEQSKHGSNVDVIHSRVCFVTKTEQEGTVTLK